jgi:hypothetical protein
MLLFLALWLKLGHNPQPTEEERRMMPVMEWLFGVFVGSTGGIPIGGRVAKIDE